MNEILRLPEVQKIIRDVYARVQKRHVQGRSPPTCVVPRSKSEFPKVLCLDQNKWIDLARAHYGREDGRDFKKVLDSIRESVRNGTLVVPVLGTNLFEAGEPRNLDRRKRIVSFMVDLSTNHSMVNSKQVLKHEIERTVKRLYKGESAGPFPRGGLIRWGMFAAIGKEPTCDNEVLMQSLYEPELSVLAMVYATERETFKKMRDLDAITKTVAESAREAGLNEKERRESEFRALFETGSTADLLMEILDSLQIQEPEFRDWLDTNLVEFSEQIPCIDIPNQLLLLRDRNPGHKTHINDGKDFAFLEVAISYGNFVVTEKSWSHLAKSLKLNSQYDTIITSDLTEIPDILRATACL